MNVHLLKSWPASFAQVVTGTKRYEVRGCEPRELPAQAPGASKRIPERTFAVGDVLVLAEWRPQLHPQIEPAASEFRRYKDGDFTGRTYVTRVTSITRQGEFGLPDGLCVLGIAQGVLLDSGAIVAKLDADAITYPVAPEGPRLHR